uniref:CRAL-TRIO domain-containing protein n=1 Tax=Norrisiella sphaerica TaxID=552664 RepID=A0A7S2QT09_9EUKA|mmetsp:Transcript_2301/g.3280  ORF Transcript_2301/g.3280 Transcript_2301/m.3280 type:complete len:314 (+) Transcript_2301:207-1148(+)|eukprot:CAMPEP_0184481722 /NCGR_PEP_ID=MMETSP0113_2-20130426/3293_1 /TAXON_ID=91329 /ORGANISM="Norrisiella sphaerica, Strain BC52" /LENGTH=313 /DNA_ID=CAMNT_0026861031 /DNA_START=226 /DNA_END=1167 /DNA_ORIENTATION=+
MTKTPKEFSPRGGTDTHNSMATPRTKNGQIAKCQSQERGSSISPSKEKAAVAIHRCFGTAMPFFTPRIIAVVQDYAGFVFPMFEDENLLEFSKKYMNVQLRTLQRFMVARKNDVKKATDMFEAYRKYKAEMLDTLTEEKIEKALGRGKRSSLLRMGQAKDGTVLICFRGCLIEKGVDPELFAACMAYKLLQIMDELGPYVEPRFTIAGATNKIKGAPNQPAGKLLSIFKAISKTLGDNLPETAEKIIIFPFPIIGRALWQVAKLFLDPKTANKFIFLPGSTKAHADPHQDFYKFVDKRECSPGWLGPIEEKGQ